MAVALMEKMGAAAGFQKRGEIRAPGSGRGEICRGDAERPAPGASGTVHVFRPMVLAYPLEGSILFETARTENDEPVETIIMSFSGSFHTPREIELHHF